MTQRPKATNQPLPEHLSKRRLTENEALVRKNNEKVQKAVEAAFPARERRDMRLHFYCECTDATCKQRLMLAPDTYKKIHRNRRRFIVNSDHWLPASERLIEQQPDYLVIEKLSFSRVRRLLKVRRTSKKPA